MEYKIGKSYFWKEREVTIIQYISKTGRVEVIDSKDYKKGVAGFWIDSFELKDNAQ